jgi:hypothetical protein
MEDPGVTSARYRCRNKHLHFCNADGRLLRKRISEEQNATRRHNSCSSSQSPIRGTFLWRHHWSMKQRWSTRKQMSLITPVVTASLKNETGIYPRFICRQPSFDRKRAKCPSTASPTSRRRGRRLWLSHHQSGLRQQRLDRVFAPRQGLARFVVGKVDAWRWLRPGVLILAAFDRIDENLNTLRTV